VSSVLGPVPTPEVVVRGEAVVEADPEVADLDAVVRVRARDRETALERCRAAQQRVVAVATAAGDAVESVETTAVSVHLEVRDRRAPGEPVASVSTRFTVRPDAVGDLVVALGRLDDVEVTGPSWRLRRDSPSLERARLDAVRDAIARARHYASAFGAELTALLEVRDVGTGGGGLRVAAAMASMARFEDSELHLDLTPPRQEVHGAVEVRFAMSEPDQEVFRG